jgi:hypothetical protein
MKNSILSMLFLTVALTVFPSQANSCGVKTRYAKKNYNTECGRPVNHTNRKMKNCNTNNSCAKKNVRMNKHAKRESCN